MDIITDSVKKINVLLKNSGCEEGCVFLDVNADIVYCQYDKGACMVATFGGRSAEFVTQDPIRARTKISFMFDAALDSLRTRAAACSIINVAAGFFCISRILHSCPESSHTDCIKQLEHEIGGKRILCIGDMHQSKLLSVIISFMIRILQMLFSLMVMVSPNRGQGISSRPAKVQSVSFASVLQQLVLPD